MSEGRWQAAIHAFGLVAAGMLIAGAIVLTEPDPPEVLPNPTPEPRFHVVWMPKTIQLLAVGRFGALPSCAALDIFLKEVDTALKAQTDGYRNAANTEWATLECRE